MTLLVAAVQNSIGWIAADALISGIGMALREREYELKIRPSNDGRALVGFAGDQHHGARILEAAVHMSAGTEAAAYLLKEHLDYPSVDLAYIYLDADGGAHLLRISAGGIEELSTCHLGEQGAFEHYQRIRHAVAIDSAPEAVKFFFTGSRAPEPVPSELSDAVKFVLRLIAERQERDVGGWVTAYLLTPSGAFLCGYGFSVSDPMLNAAAPGSELGHGTAEGGGYTISVTELGHGNGVVIYWLQKPGGLVFRRVEGGYDEIIVEGRPSDFIINASEQAGEPVDILVSDRPIGLPERISVVRDENGDPSIAIAHAGNSFSVAVLNVESEFRATTRLALGATEMPAPPTSANAFVSVADDRRSVEIRLPQAGEAITQITLDGNELTELIKLLGDARTRMEAPLPDEPPNDPGTEELMIVDPMWRTAPPIHPSLNGVIVRLRHPAFGWLTFLLPWREAANLGAWLKNASEPNVRK